MSAVSDLPRPICQACTAWRLRVGVLALGMLGMAQPALSANESACRVGFVNVEQILAESPSAQKMRQALDKGFKPREQALERRAAEIRALQASMEAAGKEPSATEQSKINRAIRDYEQERAQLESDLSTQQTDKTKDLLTRVDAIIHTIAQERDLDQVTFQAAYVKKSCDITTSVLRQLQ